VNAATEALGFDLKHVEAELCSRELVEFFRQGWGVVEPGVKFVDGWHVEAIAEHLSAVSRGEIRNLIINVPPRHSKSTLVSVMWPAWEWTFLPHTQWLYGSYAQVLSVRDSIKCRRLILSPWYQERWGNKFTLTGDQNLKTRFDNSANGYRIASSVDGSNTGEGGDRIVIDDPHNMREIFSDVVRESVIEWWRTTMSTRLNNPKTGARVLVMQRGHEVDLAGYMLSTMDDVVHLVLPGEYEPGRKCKTPVMIRGQLNKYLAPGKTFEDPRTLPGSLLTPERFGPREMRSLRVELGEFGYASQVQQRPVPDGGGILKRADWKRWDKKDPPEFDFVLQSYDTAFEEGEENDYTARTSWGVFLHSPTGDPRDARWCAMLIDMMNERLTFPDLRAKAQKSYKEMKADLILVEKKGSGMSLIQELKRAKIPVRAWKVKGDKVARAHVGSLFLREGSVYYMPRKWSETVIRQCEMFPAGEHDDIVDTCAQAWTYLRNTYKLQLSDEDDEDDKPNKPARKRFYG
jgi:predicted phage terminase large subunit-like protein